MPVHFLDNTTSLWFSGALAGKPAGVFTSTGSMHGGQESTLLTMLLPLMHHGMLIVGLPFAESTLRDTDSGGTPYGPSHLTRQNSAISRDEKVLCQAFGARLAGIAGRLRNSA